MYFTIFSFYLELIEKHFLFLIFTFLLRYFTIGYVNVLLFYSVFCVKGVLHS